MIDSNYYVNNQIKGFTYFFTKGMIMKKFIIYSVIIMLGLSTIQLFGQLEAQNNPPPSGAPTAERSTSSQGNIDPSVVSAFQQLRPPFAAWGLEVLSSRLKLDLKGEALNIINNITAGNSLPETFRGPDRLMILSGASIVIEETNKSITPEFREAGLEPMETPGLGEELTKAFNEFRSSKNEDPIINANVISLLSNAANLQSSVGNENQPNRQLAAFFRQSGENINNFLNPIIKKALSDPALNEDGRTTLRAISNIYQAVQANSEKGSKVFDTAANQKSQIETRLADKPTKNSDK